MRRSLFEKILDDLVASDSYFSQKKDALGELGFSPHQKLTSALCTMLANGTSADQLDDLQGCQSQQHSTICNTSVTQ